MNVRSALLVVSVLALSCAGQRPAVLLDAARLDRQQIVAAVAAHQEKLSSMVGKGLVTFDSPDVSGSAAFDVALKKPDSLLLNFEGPFGISLGMLFLSREKYVLYNTFENRVITGAPTGASLRSVVPFDMTLEQILSSFSGLFPLPADSVIGDSLDGELIRLSFRCRAGLCVSWIDPEYALVTRYVVTDERGEVVMEASASSIEQENNASAPKTIRVRFPRQGRQFSVKYSSLTLNDPNPSFDYTVPRSAVTIVR